MKVVDDMNYNNSPLPKHNTFTFYTEYSIWSRFPGMVTQPMNWYKRSACRQVFQAERRIHQHLSIKQIDSSCGIEYQNKFLMVSLLVSILICDPDKQDSWYWSWLETKIKTSLGIDLEMNHKSRWVSVLVSIKIRYQDMSWYWYWKKSEIKISLGIGLKPDGRSHRTLA